MWIFDLLDGIGFLENVVRMVKEGDGKGCLLLFLESICIFAMIICWAMGWYIPAAILTVLAVCIFIMEIRAVWLHRKAKRAADEEEKRKAQQIPDNQKDGV
ncbi:MAG: hypothetical protein IJN53_02535 [Oscillospiraceae bacterium]|nr:hypothetical protein [Oscillospiraceae bacterium]